VAVVVKPHIMQLGALVVAVLVATLLPHHLQFLLAHLIQLPLVLAALAALGTPQVFPALLDQILYLVQLHHLVAAAEAGIQVAHNLAPQVVDLVVARQMTKLVVLAYQVKVTPEVMEVLIQLIDLAAAVAALAL
jgi:hypothetical protein